MEYIVSTQHVSISGLYGLLLQQEAPLMVYTVVSQHAWRAGLYTSFPQQGHPAGVVSTKLTTPGYKVAAMAC
jgi:hypothetical protein